MRGSTRTGLTKPCWARGSIKEECKVGWVGVREELSDPGRERKRARELETMTVCACLRACVHVLRVRRVTVQVFADKYGAAHRVCNRNLNPKP
jgi:hypothetical protein